MKKILVLGFAICLLSLSTPSFGFSYFEMIGDNDGYGYGVADNATLPFSDDPTPGGGWIFDNRSAAELAATNGAQFTDIEPRNTLNATFNFAPFAPSAFHEGTFMIDLSGIQTTAGGQSRLWFDGIEVVNAFAGVEMGAWGSQVFQFSLGAVTLADGILDVDFASGTVGSTVDNVAIDFASLKVVTIPEPTSMALLGLGLLGTGLVRKFRK
ncbi:MAG: PEP-CTERM sorting domain-containing protein [candidate division Zixibacteria bacterium]